jgi:hypothetical protein
MSNAPIQATPAAQARADALCDAADAAMRAEAARHPADCPWCARGYLHCPMRFYPHAHVGPRAAEGVPPMSRVTDADLAAHLMAPILRAAERRARILARQALNSGLCWVCAVDGVDPPPPVGANGESCAAHAAEIAALDAEKEPDV